MKTLKILFFCCICFITKIAIAQVIPADMDAAIKKDDAAQFATLITKENLNKCYTIGDWDYTLLSQTIRSNAKKCFDLLIAQGADVNHACEGYVPPIMHAAKYGRLEMLKVLVAKGANVNYHYSGDYTPADGETPLSYAEKNKQQAVADYLKSLK